MRYLLTLAFFLFSGSVLAAYNFGVVVNNDRYTIYRSAALGEKGLEHLKKELQKKGLPFPKTIIYMNENGYSRDGFAVEEERLQTKYGYQFFHSRQHPSTYLDGHDPRFPQKDVNGDGKLDGDLEAFFRIMGLVLKESHQPVLIHCLGGRHRTGMISMALRAIQGGHWTDGPKKRKFVFPRMSVVLNPLEHEYARYNTVLFRLTNVKFIRAIQKDIRFEELVEFYRSDLNKK